jgi:hypothetical protein
MERSHGSPEGYGPGRRLPHGIYNRLPTSMIPTPTFSRPPSTPNRTHRFP